MGLLESGPLIEARLKAQCPTAGDNVFSTEDLAGVKEKGQVTPALHIVLHSYQPLSDDEGSGTRWREIWLVVAVVKNVRQNVGTQAVRQAAASLLAETVAALDGWRCPGAVGLLRSIQPPAPLITDGFGYFPLAFEVQTVTTGTENF
ncbi:MAG TPA: hypothetical protein PLU47_00830 [Azonexus sp.]|nr:hypothetical protein [Azonexus sp.]